MRIWAVVLFLFVAALAVTSASLWVGLVRYFFWS